MSDWNFTPPPPSQLGDHDVPLDGTRLQGKRIALLITGGIAAMKAPMIARALRRQGGEVVAFISQEGLRYTTTDTLEWSTTHPVVTRLTAAAEHLSDSTPFDAYLIAPATYNTINKIRHGIADSLVTSVMASALGKMERGECRVLIAPTMHGSMHNSILTESLRTLDAMGVRIIPPREDYGKHNIPDEQHLVLEVCRSLSRSPLRGMPVLVTGGPTPVPIDSVRRITNRFSGKLGTKIAEELAFRGADVLLIHGTNSYHPPDYLPCRVVSTFDEYQDAVMEELGSKPYSAAVFSAAVADYAPRTVLPGKTPSGGALKNIELVSTPKVIDAVRKKYPSLHMVTFKYQENISHEELMRIGRERLARGFETVIANRGEETGPAGEQIAWLMTAGAEPVKMTGKEKIAAAIVDHLEDVARHLCRGTDSPPKYPE